MSIKSIGFIAVILGALALFIDQEYSWVVSAILIGVGSGLFFWPEKK